MILKQFSSQEEFNQWIVEELEALQQNQIATDAILNHMFAQLVRNGSLDLEEFQETLQALCAKAEAMEADPELGWAPRSTETLRDRLSSFADLKATSKNPLTVISGGLDK